MLLDEILIVEQVPRLGRTVCKAGAPRYFGYIPQEPDSTQDKANYKALYPLDQSEDGRIFIIARKKVLPRGYPGNPLGSPV